MVRARSLSAVSVCQDKKAYGVRRLVLHRLPSSSACILNVECLDTLAGRGRITALSEGWIFPPRNGLQYSLSIQKPNAIRERLRLPPVLKHGSDRSSGDFFGSINGENLYTEKVAWLFLAKVDAVHRTSGCDGGRGKAVKRGRIFVFTSREWSVLIDSARYA